MCEDEVGKFHHGKAMESDRIYGFFLSGISLAALVTCG